MAILAQLVQLRAAGQLSAAPAAPVVITEAVDPVCGMMVNRAQPRGGTVFHDGITYYFCNPKCAAKFQADPAHYLSPDYIAPHRPKPAAETP